MTKTTYTTKIPEWFDLSNYSKCKELSNTEWHHQLSYRSELMAEIEVYGKIENKKLLKEIRKVGLPDEIWYHDSTDCDEELEKEFPKRAKYASLGNVAIRPLRALELAVFGEGMDEDISQLIAEDDERRIDIFSDEPYDLYRKLDPEDASEEEKAYVVIDMGLPDIEILSHIKEFLPRYRQFLGIKNHKKRPSDFTISQLASLSVLPYLDLRIWELQENIKIKRSVYAGTLSPANIIGEIELMQKVRPLALEAIRDPFLKMLETS